MTEDYTVLTDDGPGRTDRDVVSELLPRLEETMSEEEYHVDFGAELERAVIGGIAREIGANLQMADWHGYGFEEPEDFLDADAIAEVIAEEARWYFEDDQTGKSRDVVRTIAAFADRHDVLHQDD